MPTMTIGGVAVLPRISDYVDQYADEAANETSDSIAVVCRARRISYGELRKQINAWSRALLTAGVRKGDRVAMLCTPRAEFLIAFLATAKIGAIWVGLNPRYSVREVEYVIGDADPRLLITLASAQEQSYQSYVDKLSADRASLSVVSIGDAMASTTPLDSFLEAGNQCSDETLAAAVDAVGTLDPALIVYTSGSTGSPKGAVLSHYGLTYGATMQTTHFKLDSPSLVVCFPINHVASVADTCATTLVKGGKIVFQEQFDPEATVSATIEERCTMLGGVPTMFLMQMETDVFRNADFSALELILWGGAAMPAEIVERLRRLDKRMMTAFGMTETACHVTYTDESADLDALSTTVGRPDPHCECRIETEDGQPATSESPGELQVKGEFLMLRYWNREQATRDTYTEDGWLKTGDVAFQREDGNIRLVGRMSDMFKSGGYNVYPREIEAVIEQCPGVAIAAVVAVPDPLYQEVGIAYVAPDPGVELSAAALQDWCRERLANYKVPKTINILDELPLLPVGKVDKQALKRLAKKNGK